ncbi:hypothetical protein ILYODFUR_003739 [Ilyodon furcidens]|uniref:Uncharacterized protein n=1 Tax=Ilyodon furcidens TaxID=33524 RepID=A0ABV0SU01_9TELE
MTTFPILALNRKGRSKCNATFSRSFTIAHVGFGEKYVVQLRCIKEIFGLQDKPPLSSKARPESKMP